MPEGAENRAEWRRGAKRHAATVQTVEKAGNRENLLLSFRNDWFCSVARMSSGSKAFPVGKREKEGGARRKRGGVGGDIPRDALGKTEHTHTAANDRGRKTKKERGERIRRGVGNP